VFSLDPEENSRIVCGLSSECLDMVTLHEVRAESHMERKPEMNRYFAMGERERERERKREREL
jgi:hypothetical protein